jgi:hypothetical protein
MPEEQSASTYACKACHGVLIVLIFIFFYCHNNNNRFDHSHLILTYLSKSNIIKSPNEHYCSIYMCNIHILSFSDVLLSDMKR